MTTILAACGCETVMDEIAAGIVGRDELARRIAAGTCPRHTAPTPEVPEVCRGYVAIKVMPRGFANETAIRVARYDDPAAVAELWATMDRYRARDAGDSGRAWWLDRKWLSRYLWRTLPGQRHAALTA